MYYYVIVVVLLKKLNTRTVRFPVNSFLFTTMIGRRKSAIIIYFLHCGSMLIMHVQCCVVPVHYQWVSQIKMSLNMIDIVSCCSC